jgi:hypothetical protein
LPQVAHNPRANASPLITIAQYQSLEIKRYIENTETPGKFGTYGAEVAA